MRSTTRALASSSTSTSSTTTSTKTGTTTTIPSKSPRPLRAVVIGGGPGGLATAICLSASKGPRPWKIDVFEARPQADVTDGTDERRTYGMVIGAERALKPLVAAGLDAKKTVASRRLIATAVFPGVAPPPPAAAAAAADSPSSAAAESTFSLPKKAIMPLIPDYYDDESSSGGGEKKASDIDDPTKPGSLFMIDRAFLVRSLVEHIEEAEAEGGGGGGGEGGGASSVSLHWGAPLASLDPERRVVMFEKEKDDDDENKKKEIAYDLLVACDGGSSAARRALEAKGLLSIAELPSPVSLTDYKTFHGLDDEGAEFLGLDTSGRGTTFAMFAAPPQPPPAPGATAPAKYKGSMAVHRRPGKGNRGWSGLLSQPPGVFESLRGSPQEAYEPVLDGILGAQDPSRPWFPASWRREILRQLAAEPGGGDGSNGVVGGDIGRLARLFRASALAVPRAGVALVGDAATTNTPQLGQGAASAIEDAAVLAESVTAALSSSDGDVDGGGDSGAAAAADAAVARALSRGLEDYDARRRRARYALQDMERELAVTNRPPPPAGQEPAEDAEARAAWKSFFAEGKQRAARRTRRRRALARLLPFSRRVRRWADEGGANDLGWWNALLHSTTPYDEIYALVRGRGSKSGKEKGEEKEKKGEKSVAKATAVAVGLAAVALTVVRRAVVKA